jgi:hypothetical protein
MVDINEKTFLEKTALSRKNKSFIFPIFVQQILATLIFFCQSDSNFFLHFYLLNRMSPTKPRPRNTIILRHLYVYNNFCTILPQLDRVLKKRVFRPDYTLYPV